MGLDACCGVAFASCIAEAAVRDKMCIGGAGAAEGKVDDTGAQTEAVGPMEPIPTPLPPAVLTKGLRDVAVPPHKGVDVGALEATPRLPPLPRPTPAHAMPAPGCTT